MPIKRTLTWEEFLVEAIQYPPETLGIAQLEALVKRLELEPEFFADQVRFSDETYTRTPVFKNACFEVICICWKGDQKTSIHNHGQSFGVTAVCQGALHETIYRRTEGNSISQVKERNLTSGEVVTAPVGMIHQQRNAAPMTVSLHFYARPLDTIDVFEPETGRTYRKPMLA